METPLKRKNNGQNLGAPKKPKPNPGLYPNMNLYFGITSGRYASPPRSTPTACPGAPKR